MTIRPADFIHTEEAFLAFLRSRNIKCGRRDELSSDLRDALAGTANLDRYIPDLWAVPGQLIYIDVKSETAKNATSGNGAIELRPLLRARLNPIPPTLFIHYPDWGFADADTILAARIWACCTDYPAQEINAGSCLAAFMDGVMPPEKCPNRTGSGSGDPWIAYRLSAYRPIGDLLKAEATA